MKSKATIIPVAAGKGGVGKTLMAANLSIALAEAGHTVVAVDLDLGASNLHSYLEVRNRFSGLGDFLKGGQVDFDDLPVATSFPNLRLITGDGRSFFMGNISHFQKARLLRSLRSIEADYVILDLGAGSSFDTLDYFNISHSALLITQPEPPAILNMFVFLKNALMRQIDLRLHHNPAIREYLETLGRRSIHEQVRTIGAMRRQIGLRFPEAAREIDQICRECRPRVVFNMARKSAEMALTRDIDRVAKKTLSIRLAYYGFVYRDAAVHDAVSQSQILLRDYPDSVVSSEIRKIAKRIEKFWDREVEGSATRIKAHAIKTYRSRSGKLARERGWHLPG